MQIISHRCETLSAIHAAATYDVAYIEFDIRYTKNNKIVVYHNDKTPSGKTIAHITLKALQREVEDTCELAPALVACGNRPALVESKCKGTIARSLPELKKNHRAAVASFHADEILAARINLPSHKTFLLQRYHPFGIIRKALNVDAHGIGLNKNWILLFPYYYNQAQKNELAIYTYTVNNLWLGRRLQALFKKMLICTDYPHKFTKNTPTSSTKS